MNTNTRITNHAIAGLCCEYGQGYFTVSSGGNVYALGSTFGGSITRDFRIDDNDILTVPPLLPEAAPSTLSEDSCNVLVRGSFLLPDINECGDNCVILDVGETLDALTYCKENAVLIGTGGAGARCEVGPTTVYLDDSGSVLPNASGLLECAEDAFCPLPTGQDGGLTATPVDSTIVIDGEEKVRPGDTVFFECEEEGLVPYVILADDVVIQKDVGVCRDSELPEVVCLAQPDVPSVVDVSESTCYVCNCDDVAQFENDEPCTLYVSAEESCGETPDFSTCPDFNVVVPENEVVPAQQTNIEVKATIVVDGDCITVEQLNTSKINLEATFAAQATVPVSSVSVSFDTSDVNVCGAPVSTRRSMRRGLSQQSGGTVAVDVAIALPPVAGFQEEETATVDALADRLTTLVESQPDALFDTVLGDVSSVSASVVTEPTVLTVFCAPCDPSSEDCGGDAGDNPCPPGSRVIVPSQTVARTANAGIVLPPDVSASVASVEVIPGAAGAPPNVVLTIEIENVDVDTLSSQELQDEFVLRYVAALTEYYTTELGLIVTPGDIQVTVSAAPVTDLGAERRRVRRSLLQGEQDAGDVAALETGVSFLFPFRDIDFDVIRETGILEATQLVAEATAVSPDGAAQEQASAPGRSVLASDETILPAVFLLAADVRAPFDSARLLASSRFVVSVDPGALGGRCEGGFFAVTVPCEDAIGLSDLGFVVEEGSAEDVTARSINAVLTTITSDPDGCGAVDAGQDVSVIRASDTTVLLCSALGGLVTQLMVQTLRSPAVVDEVVGSMSRPAARSPAAAAPGIESSAADAASLLNIKRSLGSPALYSWTTETIGVMCQTWLGVECDSIGKVTRVSLMEGELVGDVRDLKWLEYLSDLAAVELASDALVGDGVVLADTLQRVAGLGELRFGSSGIQGDITGVSQLPALTALELSVPNCRGDLRMVEPLTSLESLSIMSNGITGNITAIDSLTQLSHLSLVGPMIGSGFDLQQAAGMEDVFTLGRGFVLAAGDELESVFAQMFPEAPSLPDEVEGVCVDVGGTFCASFVSSPECQADSSLGRRLREQCELSCGLCGNASGVPCEDTLDICASFASEALCAGGPIRDQCPLSCGACTP